METLFLNCMDIHWTDNLFVRDQFLTNVKVCVKCFLSSLEGEKHDPAVLGAVDGQ